MTVHTKAERDEAIARLREWLKPGDVVFTIVRHVSRGGMQRTVSIIGMNSAWQPLTNGQAHSVKDRMWRSGYSEAQPIIAKADFIAVGKPGITLLDYTYNAALALGVKWPYDPVRNGIKAFSAENLVDNLAYLLFGEGKALRNRTL